MFTKTKTLSTKVSAFALVGLLSVGLTACGNDADTEPVNTPAGNSATPNDDMGTDGGSTDDNMGDDMNEDDMAGDDMADPASGVFGPGCEAVPAEGAGSFKGMVTEPVASAASANPLLSTLVTAVTEAGLVDTLNGAPEITVFAPTNDAFGKIDKKALDGLLKDKEALTKVLTHHVVEGKLSPEDVAGTHTTLAGDKITVEGSGEEFTVDGANVVCGNVPTANATVYIIDSVLVK